jgi:hypothetical protein
VLLYKIENLIKLSDSNTYVKFKIITKMKKIYIIVFTVFLNVTFFSCTPENIVDNAQATECCGENGDIDPPPPPPPPPTGGKTSLGSK